MHLNRHHVSCLTLLTFIVLLFHTAGQTWAAELTNQDNSLAKVAMEDVANTSPLNVKSFGAKGDGVTDDSISIQRAINSLKEGGTLFFPSGKYAFGQTITLPSHIRILGDNRISTILLYTGTDKAIVSGSREGRYGTGTYYITIENIILRGRDAGTGLFITSRYMTINNAEISHFAVGMDSQYCWTNKFYNVSFFYNSDTAFRGGALLNANSFVNCIFSTGQRAVTINQCWNVSFVGCQFEGYTDACFAFNDQAKSAIWNLNISGSYFENKGKVLYAGPNASFFQLSLNNNIITTHGSGTTIQINNNNNYGKNTGIIENNSFFRENNGSTESFISIEGPAYLLFRSNQSSASPGYIPVPLLDETTRANHSSSMETSLSDGNRMNFSGVGAFNKGVIIGSTSPQTAEPGLMIYDNGQLKIYGAAGQAETVATVKSGPMSERPTNCYVGMMYFDTTLNRPIWWNGQHWVDVNGRKR